MHAARPYYLLIDLLLLLRVSVYHVLLLRRNGLRLWVGDVPSVALSVRTPHHLALRHDTALVWGW